MAFLDTIPGRLTISLRVGQPQAISRAQEDCVVYLELCGQRTRDVNFDLVGTQRRAATLGATCGC
jgi:hypothetical protein